MAFLPCLNEAGNLTALVTEIINLKIHELHIAIIVDRSTDNTEIMADKLQRKIPHMVDVLHHQPPVAGRLPVKPLSLFV